GRRQLVAQGVGAVWSPAGDGIALRDDGNLIDPDTLARRPYGLGSAVAYAPDGEHLMAQGGRIWADDRHGSGRKLLTTDSRGLPAWRGWAGDDHLPVEL